MSSLPVLSHNELAKNVMVQRPHVVLLGAGASKAAFLHGDAVGCTVPLMNELVDIVTGLRQCLETAGVREPFDDFEALYSKIIEDGQTKLAQDMESLVEKYFLSLKIPKTPTIYDHLLLSLRPKDAVFTFNWDPFLFDAYERNISLPLPEIFFLHGNVRIGYCSTHEAVWGKRGQHCDQCGKALTSVPLLFPIKNKGAAYCKPFLRDQWKNASLFLQEAFAFTIFGYSAPTTDVDAFELLKTSWRSGGDRLVEHPEIIECPGLTERSRNELYETWKPFDYYNHTRYIDSFEDSYMSLFPRRTCESLYLAGTQGIPSARWVVPRDLSLEQTQLWYSQLADHENSGADT